MVHTKAAAVQYFMKQRDYSFDAQQDAAEIKVRAERHLGVMLAAGGERRGGKSNFHGGSSTPLPDDVSHKQSHNWQRVAKVPEP